MEEFQDMLKKNTQAPDARVTGNPDDAGKKFALHKMERDSEGNERYVKADEEETIMKQKV